MGTSGIVTMPKGSKEKGAAAQKTAPESVQCYKCKEYGHFAVQCTGSKDEGSKDESKPAKRQRKPDTEPTRKSSDEPTDAQAPKKKRKKEKQADAEQSARGNRCAS